MKHLTNLMMILCIFLLTAPPADALIAQFSLDDLARKAQTVVMGEITELNSRWNKDQEPIYTEITVRVEQVWKGDVTGQTLTFDQIGGEFNGTELLVPDTAEFTKGEKVILTRIETSPEDIRGMDAAEGILTARGGMTSHAALVARQMGKVCVAGAGSIQINYKKRQFEVDGKVVKEGDWISLDGTTGEVIMDKIETKPSDVLQVLIDKSIKPEDSKTFHTYEKIMD